MSVVPKAPKVRGLVAAVCSFVAIGMLSSGAPRAQSAAPSTASYDIVEKSVVELRDDLVTGRVTSEALTQAYLARIAAVDRAGPALHSVIAVNPRALEDARRSDRDRAAHRRMGSLAGIPVLLKDNIESADGTPTTAGSDALARNVAQRDAPLVARLRRAGAVVLGKTNLSEWANFRSDAAISSWSAVGGLVKNPYSLDRSACGSSAGTGAAIAASLAAVGVGTETDGSVTCPSSINGLVGLKPTLGLISRTGVVPLSHHQDTPGPMGRSVADVAALLGALAGSDPRDPATAGADAHARDYLAGLTGASLRGKRFGVMSYALAGQSPAVTALFARTVALLRARGASVVTVSDFKPSPALGQAETTVLLSDFKSDIDAYLATTPRAVRSRTLAGLIAFNRTDPRELALFGQELFEKAQATKGPSARAYVAALRTCRALGPTIDRVVTRGAFDALIAPTYSPASRIDIVAGDQINGSIASLAAISGYPHLTVPMGDVRGLPVGLSFVGLRWHDAELLDIGAAYERASNARRPPRYLPSIEGSAPIQRLFAPENEKAP